MNYYTLSNIYIPLVRDRELSIGLYTAEFRPKRKKLKYWQKKKRR